jgi:hypothetical protein
MTSRAKAAGLALAAAMLLAPRLARAGTENVPMLALGPLFEQTTGAHFAGYGGVEHNWDYQWFVGGRLFAASTPGFDAFVEGGHYFSEQIVSLSAGVGVGWASRDEVRPVLVGSLGLLGRLVSLDVGVRPGAEERRQFVSVMIDVPHGLLWLISCGGAPRVGTCR